MGGMVKGGQAEWYNLKFQSLSASPFWVQLSWVTDIQISFNSFQICYGTGSLELFFMPICYQKSILSREVFLYFA